MSIVEFDFVVFPSQRLSRQEAARWFRDAVEKVGLGAAGLAVLPHAAAWWKTADPLLLAGGAVLGHRELAAEALDESWAIALYYMDYPTKAGVVGSVPVEPLGKDGRSLTWQWLVEFLDLLVTASDADLCMVNGSSDDDDESEGLPTEAELETALPGALTAWTYLGPERLADATRQALARLPAFSSRPLRDGWVLRPVNDFSDNPPRELLERYHKLAGHPVRFLHAFLEKPENSKGST